MVSGNSEKLSFGQNFLRFGKYFLSCCTFFLSFNLFSFKFWLTFCDFTHFYLNFALIFWNFPRNSRFSASKKTNWMGKFQKAEFHGKNPEFWANLLSFGKILSFGVAEFWDKKRKNKPALYTNANLMLLVDSICHYY